MSGQNWFGRQQFRSKVAQDAAPRHRVRVFRVWITISGRCLRTLQPGYQKLDNLSSPLATSMARFSAPVLLGILLLGVGLAGCAGAGTDSRPADVDVYTPTFDEDTGAVSGRVTDESLLPIVEARVVLDDAKTTFTDGNGSFAFGFVEPGAHKLVVTHDRYETGLVQIVVERDGIAEAHLVLTELPATRPHHETMTGAGILTCHAGFSVAGEQGEEISCSTDGELSNYVPVSYQLGAMDNVSNVLAETTWEAAQATANGMLITWYIEYDDILNPVFHLGTAHGESPVVHVMNRTLFEQALDERQDPACTQEDCTITGRHKPFGLYPGTGVVDIGLMIDQHFEEYVTVFYNQNVPADFSALPDA